MSTKQSAILCSTKSRIGRTDREKDGKRMKGITSFDEYHFTVGDACFTFLNANAVPIPLEDHHAEHSQFHTHRWYEIFYAMNGSLEIYTQDGKETLQQGDLAIVPSKLLHRAFIAEESRNVGLLFDIQAVRYDGEERYAERFRQLLDRDSIAVLRSFDHFGSFKRLMIYQSYHYEDSDRLIAACLQEIVFLIKDGLSTSTDMRTAEVTLENTSYRDYIIENYINSRFYENPSLEELAGQLHISIQQLQRIVKKRYGQSFSERIFFLKMQNASHLLEETDTPVGEVAQMLGYVSAYSFFTAFKRQFGMTPKQYRDSKKNIPGGKA